MGADLKADCGLPRCKHCGCLCYVLTDGTVTEAESDDFDRTRSSAFFTWSDR